MRINLGPKAERKLGDLLLAYIKQVELPPLQSPRKRYGYVQQFMCGPSKSAMHAFGMTWGITIEGKRILDSIVSVLRREYYASETRREILRSTILKMFQENCLDPGIFDGNKLYFLKVPKKTLFDCSGCSDYHTLATRLLNLLIAELQRKSQQSIFLYPLDRITIENGIYSESRFSLLNTSYESGWGNLRSRLPVLKQFDPVSNVLFGHKPTYQDSSSSSWLVYEFDGDFDDSYNLVLRDIRVLLSFMVAAVYPNDPSIVYSSIASDGAGCIVFSEEGKCSERAVSTLLHAFPGRGLVIDMDLEQIVSKGMTTYSLSDQQKKKRFSLFASYFIARPSAATKPILLKTV